MSLFAKDRWSPRPPTFGFDPSSASEGEDNSDSPAHDSPPRDARPAARPPARPSRNQASTVAARGGRRQISPPAPHRPAVSDASDHGKAHAATSSSHGLPSDGLASHLPAAGRPPPRGRSLPSVRTSRQGQDQDSEDAEHESRLAGKADWHGRAMWKRRGQPGQEIKPTASGNGKKDFAHQEKTSGRRRGHSASSEPGPPAPSLSTTQRVEEIPKRLQPSSGKRKPGSGPESELAKPHTEILPKFNCLLLKSLSKERQLFDFDRPSPYPFKVTKPEDLSPDSDLALQFFSDVLALAFGPQRPGAPAFPQGVPRFPTDVPDTGDPSREGAHVEIQGPALEAMVFLNHVSQPNEHQVALHQHVAQCGLFVKQIWVKNDWWPEGLQHGPGAPSLSELQDFLQTELGPDSWDGILQPLFEQLLRLINDALISMGDDPHPSCSKPFSTIVLLQHICLGKGQTGHFDVFFPGSHVCSVQLKSVQRILQQLLAASHSEESKKAKVHHKKTSSKATTKTTGTPYLPFETALEQLRWVSGSKTKGWAGGASEAELFDQPSVLVYDPPQKAYEALLLGGKEAYRQCQEAVHFLMEGKEGVMAGNVLPAITACHMTKDIEQFLMDPKAALVFKDHWADLLGGEDAVVVDERCRSTGSMKGKISVFAADAFHKGPPSLLPPGMSAQPTAEDASQQQRNTLFIFSKPQAKLSSGAPPGGLLSKELGGGVSCEGTPVADQLPEDHDGEASMEVFGNIFAYADEPEMEVSDDAGSTGSSSTAPVLDYNVRRQCVHTVLVLAACGILSEKAACCFSLQTFALGLQPVTYVQQADLTCEVYEEEITLIEELWQKREKARVLQNVQVHTPDEQESFTQACTAARQQLQEFPFPLRLKQQKLHKRSGKKRRPRKVQVDEPEAGKVRAPDPALVFDTKTYMLQFLMLVHLLIGMRGAVFLDYTLDKIPSSEYLTGMPWFGPVPPDVVRAVVRRIMQDVHALEKSKNYWSGSIFGTKTPDIAGVGRPLAQKLMADVDALIIDNMPASMRVDASGGGDSKALENFRLAINTAEGDAPPDNMIQGWTRAGARDPDNVAKRFSNLMSSRADGYLLEAVADPVSSLADMPWVLHLVNQDQYELGGGDSAVPLLHDVLEGLQELVQVVQRAEGRIERAQMRLSLWTPRSSGGADGEAHEGAAGQGGGLEDEEFTSFAPCWARLSQPHLGTREYDWRAGANLVLQQDTRIVLLVENVLRQILDALQGRCDTVGVPVEWSTQCAAYLARARLFLDRGQP